MILLLIPDAKTFLQAKAYVSKDSPKQDGFFGVESKLITGSEKTMVIARDNKYSLISMYVLLQPPLLKAIN